MSILTRSLSRRNINQHHLILYQKSSFSPKFEYFSFQLPPGTKSSSLVVYMLHLFAFFLCSSLRNTQKTYTFYCMWTVKTTKNSEIKRFWNLHRFATIPPPRSQPASLTCLLWWLAFATTHTSTRLAPFLLVDWVFVVPLLALVFYSPSLDIFYYTNSSKFTNIECHAFLRSFFIPRMGLWSDYERGRDGLFFLYSVFFCELTFVYHFIDMWTHVLIHGLSGKECGFF